MDQNSSYDALDTPTLTNLLFANGFSGHGLQQAPAVGRGLAEWIVTGHYETITGADSLALALLELHAATHGLTNRLPANTIDR